MTTGVDTGLLPGDAVVIQFNNPRSYIGRLWALRKRPNRSVVTFVYSSCFGIEHRASTNAEWFADFLNALKGRI